MRMLPSRMAAQPMSAAQNEHTATVVALAQECRADVNAANKIDFTALMSAAQNGHTATVVALAQVCRADVNAGKQNGLTTLMSVVEGGHQSTVLRLVNELKVDVGASNSVGASCLFAMGVSSRAAASSVMALEDRVHDGGGCKGCRVFPVRGP